MALAIGLLVGEILQPGAGLQHRSATIDPKSVATYVTKAKEEGIVAHLMAIIPDSYLRRARPRRSAAGAAGLDPVRLCHRASGQGRRADRRRDRRMAAKMFFGIIRIIVRVAPIGAFGAMAFTVGAYGLGSLWQPRSR